MDLAAKNPQKLEELKKLFAAEAEKYQVYPLDDRFVERGINPERPSVIKGRTKFSYAAGTTRIPKAVPRQSISARTRSPRKSRSRRTAVRG